MPNKADGQLVKTVDFSSGMEKKRKKWEEIRGNFLEDDLLILQQKMTVISIIII